MVAASLRRSSRTSRALPGVSEPQAVALLLSERCNNRCRMCIAPDALRGTDCSGAILRHGLLRHRARGFTALEISGFESLVRPDAPELIRFARDAGYERIHVITNARELARPGLAAKLIAAGTTSFTISFHASTARMEEAVSGVRGGFEGKVRGLGNLVRAVVAAGSGVLLRANVVILRENHRSLRSVCRLLHGLGLREVHLCFMSPLSSDLGRYFAHVVRYSRVGAPLRAALQYLRDRGMDYRVVNVPHCRLREFPEAWPRIRHEAPSLRGAPTIPRVREAFYRFVRASQKVKPATCASCRFTGACPGVDDCYLDRFGPGELRPIRGSARRSSRGGAGSQRVQDRSWREPGGSA
ncbi:MAG: hypothetical protein HY907_00095 [Deltaproteobacteria bacterium]|nr:hypothetical protein [Deltaproteobacteria bacterium]